MLVGRDQNQELFLQTVTYVFHSLIALTKCCTYIN